MICKNCGMKLSGNMKFCPSCGSVIPGNNGPLPGNVSVCRKCGRTLPPGSRFCELCGTPVQTTISPPNYQMRPKTVLSEGIRENREKKEQIQKRVNQSRRSAIIPLSIIVVLIGAGLFYIFIHTVFRKNNGSDYKNRYRYNVATFSRKGSDEKILIDSEGNTIASKNRRSNIMFIGDNGISAGISYEILPDGTLSSEKIILFIIKEGQYIEITDKLFSEYSAAFQLCGSGKKLFYQETDEKIYSYDTENGRRSEIYEGSSLRTVSYNGEVIIFSDGYCKMGKKEPFCVSFYPSYVEAASDSGKHVYFNELYQTRSGNAESQSVDFSVANAASYKEDGVVPTPYKISRSESIYSRITAHNTDFNEILFEYDGDTYYYNDKKQSKTLICSGALLYPVEGFRMMYGLDRMPYDVLDYSLTQHWKNDGYIDVSSEIDSNYDPAHSVNTIKNHVYCMFSDDTNSTISLVYLTNDLHYKILVDDITGDPIVSNEGTYIWVVSNNRIYRIDMTGKDPKIKSRDVSGLTYYDFYNSYPCSLPIALSENGKNAYCIGDLLYYDDSYTLSGTLYYVNMEGHSVSAVDNDVIRCISNEQDTVYYLNNDSPVSRTGTLYSFSKKKDMKQISSDVNNMILIGKDLFLLKPAKSEESNNKYDLYKLEDGLFRPVVEGIDFGWYCKN